MELEGLEPIMEENRGASASVSSCTNDMSLASLLVADSQWIYFSSDSIPCLMAQLGPVAPLKPESYKDFFTRYHCDAIRNDQKDVPQKGSRQVVLQRQGLCYPG